jgi:hypothetical protein
VLLSSGLRRVAQVTSGTAAGVARLLCLLRDIQQHPNSHQSHEQPGAPLIRVFCLRMSGFVRRNPTETQVTVKLELLAASGLLFDGEGHIYVGAVILGSEAYHDGALVGFVFTGDHASDFSIGAARHVRDGKARRFQSVTIE